MTKPQIAERLARELQIPVSRATIALNRLFATRKGKGLILSELEAGRPFRIAGFGAFAIRKRKARMGRNPKTGQRIKIPPRRYVVFQVGDGARRRLTP